MMAGGTVRTWMIFVHRWLGVVLCLLFLVWFASAIGMMYWDFPGVTPADRLAHAAALDLEAVKLSAAEAYAKTDGEPLDEIRLNTYDGRPVYRFRSGRTETLVYADTAERRSGVSVEMVSRLASAWAGQPAAAARAELVEDVDQWTLQSGVRNLKPLWKYSWPDGQQLYLSQRTGDVVQYTTTVSRIGAYLGPIPHWLYFTPIRRHQQFWSRFVIWSSAVGTFTAILGMVVALVVYSPSKRYREKGKPASFPYRGIKRWHAILGLMCGAGAITWAFSGMLSMDPFPMRRPPSDADVQAAAAAVEGALRGPLDLEAFQKKPPADALRQLGGAVKQLELVTFAGAPTYLATLSNGETRVVPVDGEPAREFSQLSIIDAIGDVADVSADVTLINQYDAYYLDRRRQRPLPVVLVQFHDPDRTRLYIDPKSARIVETYSSGEWIARWLYHGLHSFNFPWLYNYRPIWDVVVLAFMSGGTALSLTSLVLAWRVLGRRLFGRGA